MIEIFEDAGGKWRFRVKGKNGEKVVTSQGYTRKGDAARAFRDLKAIVAELDAPTDE